MSRRDFLVIVRAGDRSLHPQWLAGAGDRNWDLIVNYYGDDPERYRGDDLVRIDSKGPKWPALHDLIASHPELIAGYRYVWLPDDDLLIDKAGINQMFRECVDYRLEAAQPALTWDSYSTHLVTLQHRSTRIRYTNFVEIMGPCFSASMLQKALPLFDGNLSGWGLDFVWTKLADKPADGVAILDTVTMRHTRPIGGPNYKLLREQGVAPLDELRSFCKRHDIDPQIAVHKVITRNGRSRSVAADDRRFLFRDLLDIAPALRVAPDRPKLAFRMYKFILASAFNRPHPIADLSEVGGRIPGQRALQG